MGPLMSVLRTLYMYVIYACMYTVYTCMWYMCVHVVLVVYYIAGFLPMCNAAAITSTHTDNPQLAVLLGRCIIALLSTPCISLLSLSLSPPPSLSFSFSSPALSPHPLSPSLCSTLHFVHMSQLRTTSIYLHPSRCRNWLFRPWRTCYRSSAKHTRRFPSIIAGRHQTSWVKTSGSVNPSLNCWRLRLLPNHHLLMYVSYCGVRTCTKRLLSFRKRL